MKFPNTVSVNTLKSYVNLLNCKDSDNKLLNAVDFDWDVNNYPEPLRVQCIKVIGENWHIFPIFSEINDIEDRNYLLDIIDVNISIKDLSQHIQDDVFWKRCFQNYWQHYYPTQIIGKNWITIFMEKYLSEKLEMMRPRDYEIESVQYLLDICSPYIETLHIQQLQPPLDDNENNHIPFDLILKNLLKLNKINLTFDVKSINTNYFLGCSNITENDIKQLANGLMHCYVLKEFRLHNNKLEPYMLKILGNALQKACTHLETLSFPHCNFGDIGLKTFLTILNYESFPYLKILILTNNNITHEGALELANVISTRNIEVLDLRLNPLKSDGASVIFSVLYKINIKELNLSCCSIDTSIGEQLLKFLQNNSTLKKFNLSINKLGKDIGGKIVSVLKNHSKQLQEFDIRNTDIQSKEKFLIDSMVLSNRDKI